MHDGGEKKKHLKEIVFHIVKILVAVTLIYWVVKDIKLEELSSRPLSRLLACWGIAFLLVFLQSTLSAFRWQLLVKAQGIRLSFFRAFFLTFQGIFFSLCLPGGAVGGDVVKAAFIVKETSGDKKVEAVTSIFMDRLAGLIALFGLTLGFCLVKLPEIITFEKTLQATIYTLAAVCAAGLSGAFFFLFHDLFLRFTFIRKCVEKMDRIAKGGITRILSSVDVYRKKWKTLFFTCILGIFVIHPLLFLALYFVTDILTGKMQDLPAVFFASAMGNTASCIPGTVGGLGARDKVMQVLLETAGISATDAAVAPLLYTLGYISSSLLGAFFFVLDSFLQKMRRN